MPSIGEPPVLAETDPDAVERVIEALRAGKPVIVPTDTVYGLAVRADDAEALDEVFALKDRPAERAVAVLVADLAQATTIARLGAPERRLAERFWPGPLTIIAPAKPDVVVITAPDNTVGLRVPDRALIRHVAAGVGPLATTSANRSGQVTPSEATQAAAALTGPVGLVLDGGTCSGAPSSVVRTSGPTLEVLRSGSLRPEVLAATADLVLAARS